MPLPTSDASTDEGPPPLVGIFIGGRGARMGGVTKGLLRAPSGETILTRLARELALASPEVEIFLVGAHPELDGLPWPSIEDDPRGQGPLGGLRALLSHAERRGRDALALASDLPLVDAALLRRVMHEAPEARLYAPRIEGVFQPLFARYAPAAILPFVEAVFASPRKSLLAVLERARAREMPLDAEEEAALRDWDEPSDLPAALRAQLPRRD